MNPQSSLGRLSIVKPREVWPDEARDFTPWLLSNSDVLSELLGRDLVLERAEHPVGGFFLDIIGGDEATNQVVIVENQLAESDHRHLGQILTYAAGTKVNASRLETLVARKTTVGTAFGGPLQWEHMEGLKATHLRIRTDVADVAIQNRWDEWITWLISTGERLRSAVDAAGGVVAAPQV